jgi:hypothetical protein
MRAKRGAASILASGVLTALLFLSVGMAVAQPTSSSSTTSSTSPSTSSSTAAPTTVAPTTTSARATTTSSSTSTSTSTTAAPASKDDEAGLSDTALALIAAIVTLLVIILIIVLLMRRRAHDQWRDDARSATAEARQFSQIVTRGLATLSQPAAAAQTWGEVDQLGVQLHSRLLGLMAKPPTPQLGGAVSSADRSLQTLRTAVESDRGLRVGPPPPTEAQLGYSEAQIRERATEFNQSVDELSAHLTAR